MDLKLTVIGVLFLWGPLAAAETGVFWHVTDFHYDHTYLTSQLSCNEKVPNPGPFGDYWCDSPWLLVQNTISSMASLKKDVDFILWTGDSVAHIALASLTPEIGLEVIGNITTALNNSFNGVSVYATLGNHDFYPTNEADYKSNETYTKVASIWEDWIGNQSEIEQFKKGGYYMARVSPKIRLLALNTNLYYTSNRLTADVDDPTGQIAWMEGQLKAANDSGEKVIVTGHIPPGLATPGLSDWYYPRHKIPFMKVLLEYSDVIVATHFGHDHSDGFKILQNKDGTKAVTQFTAPSVTPWRYKTATTVGDPHNPGIRLVSYDRDTGAHYDYIQHYINITESNKQNNTTWDKLYSFRQEYNVLNMSVVALREIFSQMESSKVKLTSNKYCTNSVVSYYPINCTDDTRAQIYCAGLNYDLKEAEVCKQDYLKSLNGAPLHALSSCIISLTILWTVFVTLF